MIHVGWLVFWVPWLEEFWFLPMWILLSVFVKFGSRFSGTRVQVWAVLALTSIQKRELFQQQINRPMRML
jgi:hypothetical protein